MGGWVWVCVCGCVCVWVCVWGGCGGVGVCVWVGVYGWMCVCGCVCVGGWVWVCVWVCHSKGPRRAAPHVCVCMYVCTCGEWSRAQEALGTPSWAVCAQVSRALSTCTSIQAVRSGEKLSELRGQQGSLGAAGLQPEGLQLPLPPPGEGTRGHCTAGGPHTTGISSLLRRRIYCWKPRPRG